MVISITPTYYAENIGDIQYELTGYFENLPDDAIGLLSDNNNNPIKYIDDDRKFHLFSIKEKNERRIVMAQQTTGAHTFNSYLGAIVSADRKTIYWENTTRPMP